jgi:hypothetical protein
VGSARAAFRASLASFRPLRPANATRVAAVAIGEKACQMLYLGQPLRMSSRAAFMSTNNRLSPDKRPGP